MVPKEEKVMQPVAYVFVIFSTKMGIERTALLCEYGSDEQVAYEAVRDRLPKELLIYSSFAIYNKQSHEWGFYARFVKDQVGEFVDGLRFCKMNPDNLMWELRRETADRVVENCYLSGYGRVASYEISGVEYVAVFDWYDVNIDAACCSVVKYLPQNAELCGVFNGTSSTMCREFMTKHGNRGVIRIGAIDFLCMTADDAIKEFSNDILHYNSMACDDLENRLFVGCSGDEY